MNHRRPGRALRIYVKESDKAGDVPLYEAIVLKARQLGIEGATVLRGPMGFGADREMHTTKLLRLSGDLPCVVEIVDTAEHIEALLARLEPMIDKGIATLTDVEFISFTIEG